MKYELKDPLEERTAKTDAMRAQHEADVFTELEFRPLRMKDILALDEVDGTNHRAFKLLELLTGKRPRQLMRLSPRDFLGASAVVDKLSTVENETD